VASEFSSDSAICAGQTWCAPNRCADSASRPAPAVDREQL